MFLFFPRHPCQVGGMVVEGVMVEVMNFGFGVGIGAEGESHKAMNKEAQSFASIPDADF
jgi:hypothetical protein